MAAPFKIKQAKQPNAEALALLEAREKEQLSLPFMAHEPVTYLQFNEKLVPGANVIVEIYDEGTRLWAGEVEEKNGPKVKIARYNQVGGGVSHFLVTLKEDREIYYRHGVVSVRLANAKEEESIQRLKRALVSGGLPESERVGGPQVRRRGKGAQVAVMELTAKETAAALARVISKEPHGAKNLARLAGIGFSVLVRPVLEKLAEAGKIKKIEEDGKVKWAV
jgi:hypothetical protein